MNKNTESVKHLGGWRFEVQSASDRYATHLVDLTAPLDEICDCQRHYCQVGPALKRGEPLLAQTSCRHVQLIGMHIFNEILSNARSEINEGNESETNQTS